MATETQRYPETHPHTRETPRETRDPREIPQDEKSPSLLEKGKEAFAKVKESLQEAFQPESTKKEPEHQEHQEQNLLPKTRGSQFEPVRESLKSLSASDLCPQIDKVYTIPASASIAEAALGLNKSGYLSAPVVDESGKIISHFDFLDAIGYLVSSLKHFVGTQEGEEAFDEKADQMVQKPVKLGANFSGRDPSKPIQKTMPADDCVRSLAGYGMRRSRPLHRRTVVDDEGRPYGMICQTDVCRWLYNEFSAGKYSELAKKSIKDFGLCEREPVTIRADNQLFYGCQRLHSNHINGAPVVDNEKKLVGTLSVTGLRKVFESNFGVLQHTVYEFLTNCYPEGLKPTTCDCNTSLEDALHLMLKNSAHRLIVVDSENRPTAVVSMTDILYLVAFA